MQRGIRQNFLDSYPGFEPFIDEILPKKAQLDSIKLFGPSPQFPMDIGKEKRKKEKECIANPNPGDRPEKSTLYTIDSTPLFYQPQDGPPIPHLKLIHAYPTALPTIQIDRGAIRFVLSGAALMAPGLTSPGGRLPEKEKALEKGQVVAVVAEGKENACLVGSLKVGTEEMKKKGKGVVMDDGHYLGDGLWKMPLE